MKIVNLLLLFLQGIPPTLTPILVLVVACVSLLLALLLVLLAFFPELADSIGLILDAVLCLESRKCKSHSSRRLHKHSRGN